MRGAHQPVVNSDCQSKRKSVAKQSEDQDVPQLAHLLYAFSPTGAILGLSLEGCNTEQVKRKSPNCQPSKGSGKSENCGDDPAHGQILL